MNYTKSDSSQDDTSYNGWTNRQTWLVNLWLTNERGIHDYIHELVSQNDDPIALVDQMKSDIEDNNPLIDQASVYADLLNSAMAQVDWYEIAQHFIDEHNSVLVT